MKKKEDVNTEFEILEVQRGTINFYMIGESPLLLNKMSEKAKRDLLLPKGRLTAHDKLTKLKHDPQKEFRDSAHVLKDGPTVLAFPSSGFKAAMTTAALDLPGLKKSQIGRWCFVENQYVRIYGVPFLYMTTTRMADMNHTPDIRTLCIVDKWAACISVSFVQSFLKPNHVMNLVAAGGVYVGIGDGRPEKGKLSFGRYRMVPENDPEYLEIVKTGGRVQQEKAMLDATPYDEESASLLQWYLDEIKNRNFQTNTSPKVMSRSKKADGKVDGEETQPTEAA